MSDKALLIGINKYETVSPLRGCVNDVSNMGALLREQFGFRDIVTLLDGQARKSDVQKQMKWLLEGAKPGDRLVLHFSGHGAYTADEDGDEAGGADELLCLVNMSFDNPNTYLTDDELRKWTKKLPAGAKLLVVLDCCHSGTGTRVALRPDGGAKRLVVEADTNARFATATRSGGVRATALLDPDAEYSILARFVPPPEHIAERVRRARGRGRMRTVVTADLNHLLIAACRDDQTAADAYLANDFHGAFTYNLCRAVKATGPRGDRTDIHNRVERALRDGQFSQVPQFEGPRGSGTLFDDSPDRPGRPDDGPEPSPGPRPGGPNRVQEKLQAILAGPNPTDYERRMVLEIIHTLVTGGRAGEPVVSGRSAGERVLVCVHGISRHPSGFSNPWWEALRPHVGDLYGDGSLNAGRREVLWSDLVNRSLSRPSGQDTERLRQEIADTVQDRANRDAATATADRGPTGPVRSLGETLDRGVIDGLGWDDFLIYMTDDEMRRRIIGRFLDVVRPLLRAGTNVDVISHSWGTVVAYEGLRELADTGLGTAGVKTFFTVGSALSIPPVRWRLRPQNRDGQKPVNVGRWINLDATGDLVGGALTPAFRVDDEFLSLTPTGCDPNWLGLYNLSCAHGSYFKSENVAVNRDIFARFAIGG